MNAPKHIKTPKDVDSYIREAPKEVRGTLIALRRVIKKAAPKATERISYGMPAYGYGGSGYKVWLVSFATFKKHVSLFISPSDYGDLPKKLQGYRATKSAFHFSLDKTFPFALIGRAVKTLDKKKVAKNLSPRP